MIMATRTLAPPKVVSREEWLSARKALFVEEKEMTHKLDELRKERRHLPWVKINKPYVFEGPNGKYTVFRSVPRSKPARRLSLPC